MKIKKLQDQINILSDTDWKHLQSFLKSGLVKTSPAMQRILGHAQRQRQNKQPIQQEKEELLKIAFPKTNANIKQLTNACSDLSVAIDQYFAFHHLQSEKQLMGVLKAKAYGEKDNTYLFERVLNQSLVYLEEKEEKALSLIHISEHTRPY